MEAIYATKPGTHKRVKTYGVNRPCAKCGVRLSVYNRQETCYTCTRR